jgi:hypothetical protein
VIPARKLVCKVITATQQTINNIALVLTTK